MGGSTLCFSIESRGGFCVRGEVATGGRATRSDLMRVGFTRPRRRSDLQALASFWVRRAGERKERRFLEPEGRRTGGGTEEDEHVPPGPFVQRLCSIPTLYLTSA